MVFASLEATWPGSDPPTSRREEFLLTLRSNCIYGRDIKHVMLLHLGGFETVTLPQLLELLQQRGSRLVTLQDAESDSAYTIDPDLPFHSEGTLLQQMMAAKHIPELQPSENPFSKLDAVCR